MQPLTDYRVFEAPWDEAEGRPLNLRRFLPGTEKVGDIHLVRVSGVGALVDIPQRFVYHSPTGFQWGYGGSGPADLALNILGLFVHPAEAWRLHHDYKADVIARLKGDGPYTITAESVRQWLSDQWTRGTR